MAKQLDSLQTNEITSTIGFVPRAQKYVFTLVHGTWGRARPFRILARISGSRLWFEEGSAFHIALKAQVPQARLFTFNWSGKNSHSARRVAAQALGKTLERRCAEHGDARHFVIAHSHGGNVACYALRDNVSLQAKMSGVICLATPFVDVRPRQLTSTEKAWWMIINFVGFGWLYSKVYELISMLLISQFGITDGWTTFGTGSSFLLSFITAVWLATDFQRRCMVIAKEITLPEKLLPPLLLVRTAADEATIMLVLCQVGSGLLRRLTDLMLLPAVIVERLFQWLGRTMAKTLVFVMGERLSECFSSIVAVAFGVISFCIFGMMIIEMIIEWWWEKRPDDPYAGGAALIWIASLFVFRKYIAWAVPYTGFLWLLYYYVKFYLPPMLGILAQILTFLTGHNFLEERYAIFPIICCAGCILTTLVLGAKLAPAYIHFDIAVEPSPPGNHLISQFPLAGDMKERARIFLNHSISYQKPEVIERISQWAESIQRFDHRDVAASKVTLP